VACQSKDRRGAAHNQHASCQKHGKTRRATDHKSNDRDCGSADHCPAFADSANQDPRGQVADELAEHQHGRNQCGHSDARALLLGNDRDDRDDGALSDAKKQRG
jgi:hypothetical protein